MTEESARELFGFKSHEEYEEWRKRMKEREFNRRCDIIRGTRLTSEMSYKERLQMQRKRYGC